jgi:hypothetical protein
VSRRTADVIEVQPVCWSKFTLDDGQVVSEAAYVVLFSQHSNSYSEAPSCGPSWHRHTNNQQGLHHRLMTSLTVSRRCNHSTTDIRRTCVIETNGLHQIAGPSSWRHRPSPLGSSLVGPRAHLGHRSPSPERGCCSGHLSYSASPLCCARVAMRQQFGLRRRRCVMLMDLD